MNELYVVDAIIRFRESTNSNEFSYHQIMKWYMKNRRRLGLAWVHWHAFEREIRSLAQRGYLKRSKAGNRAVFQITNKIYKLKEFLERKAGEGQQGPRPPG